MRDGLYDRPMEIDLAPEQPPQVVDAVARLLERGQPLGGGPVDPWWQAGIDAALYEGAPPRRTPGAARA